MNTGYGWVVVVNDIVEYGIMHPHSIYSIWWEGKWVEKKVEE